MKKMHPESNLDPLQLKSDSRFNFRCHKDAPCFNKCCSNIRIVLTPYDILRMKKKLNLTSTEFLMKYGRKETLDKTSLPLVTLKMSGDDEKSCFFLATEGCGIYPDRPASCRYYPIGFATMKKADAKDKEAFYFFVREDHCLGFEEDAEWTVQSWREDQGADLYDRMNADWFEILLKTKSLGQVELSERSLNLFHMVSYELDTFRKFVFESPFLETYDIPADVVEEIRADDTALMRFGLSWLKSVLFDEGKYKPRKV
ncbi:MAG: YkgJ family cysteine cluster protein [bacterium]|nr:YkgJ family cysteine cluster protein [bacterium]